MILDFLKSIPTHPNGCIPSQIMFCEVNPSSRYHQVFQDSKTWCLGTKFFKTQKMVFKNHQVSMAPSFSKPRFLGTTKFFKIQKLGAQEPPSMAPSFFKPKDLVLRYHHVWHKVLKIQKLGAQVPSFSKPVTWCLGTTKFGTMF